MDIIQSTRISSTSASNSPLSATYAVSNIADDQPGKPFISSATSETISVSCDEGARAIFLFGLMADSATLEVATAKRLWLPPGLWVNWRKPSQVFHGPKELVLENLKLSDSPVFVNSSAIIPIQTDVESSNIPHQAFPIIDPAVWVMFPSSGATIASGELFEDDGKTMDYRKKDNCGIHTTITATITRQESNEQDLPVGVELKPIYEQHTVVAEATNGFLV